MSYFAVFGAAFDAVLTKGTQFAVGEKYVAVDIKLYPDNPTGGVQSASFAESGDPTVWLKYSDGDGEHLVECVLTHGSNRVGGGATAEDIWVVQVVGSSQLFVLTSGGYTTITGATEQINSSIALSDLDQLVQEQPKPTTTVSAIDISADSGIDGDFVTNVPDQIITAELSQALLEGEQLFGSVDGGTTWVEITSSTTGTALSWTGVTLVAGVNDILLKVANEAGDGPVASQPYTLDTTAPALSLALANDTGSSDSDAITSDGALEISDAAADATRAVRVNGVEVGSSYVPPTTDGDYTVEVCDTDTAGNTTSRSLTFTLDTTAPALSLALANDTGSSDSDAITSDGALEISDAAADTTRVVRVNGVEVGSSYVPPTTDGDYTVEVCDTDTAGNTTSRSLTFTLDTTAPALSLALANDTGSSDSDAITSDGALEISDAAADATRAVRVNGVEVGSSYVPPTTDGDYTVEVCDTDTAGNTTSRSLTFTLDTTAPALSLALANDTGSSDSDAITSDGALEISGVEADATLYYSTDGGTSWESGFAATEGSNTVLVRQVDTAGNTTSRSLTFTLDTTAPALSLALANDTGSSDNDAITSDGALEISDAAADTTRAVRVTGVEVGSSYVPPTTDGDYTVEVYDTDTAGNTTSRSLTFTLDTTAPAAVSAIDISIDTGIDGDFVTSAAIQTVTATLSTMLGSAERLLGSADGGNSWTDITGFVTGIALNWTGVLLTGSSSLQFRSTDPAGNAGPLAVQTYALVQEPQPAPGPEYAVHRDGIDFRDPALTYTGPVAELEYYWYGTDRSEAVCGTLYNDFIVLSSGDDATDGGAGNDVLDGGTGSNFLTGGAGLDTFFVDARGAGVTWSTVTDWQAGEQLSIWGWQSGVSSAKWVNNAGEQGWTGATMHCDMNGDGTIDASVTWTGLSRSDIAAPTEAVIEGNGVLWFF